MARPFDTIKVINDHRETWKLVVRVEDLWSVVNKTNQEHLEVLPIDAKGDKIQVVVPSENLELWKQTIKEGKTYVMKNFRVQVNDFQFKFTSHAFKLVFTAGTRVVDKHFDDIPVYKFNFKALDDINAGKYQPDLLVDVIGIFTKLIFQLPTPDTRKTQISFLIQDAQGNNVTCTLWGLLASKLIKSYGERTDEGPIIVVLKHARIKEASRAYPTIISNAWNGTKLFINPTFKECIQFKESLPLDVLFTTQRDIVSTGTHYQSQGSMSSQTIDVQSFMKQAPVKHISELMSVAENSFWSTVATTKKIIVNKFGWSYNQCSVCTLKTHGDRPPYVCSNGHSCDVPTVKFKVDVEVVFGNAKLNTVWWDQHCVELCGESAADIRAKLIREGEDDPLEYPNILHEKMLRKTFALRLKMQPKWKQASVVAFNQSKEIVSAINDMLPANENTYKLCIEKSVTETKSHQKSEENYDSTQFPTQSLSATAKYDPDKQLDKTPAKRMAAVEPEGETSDFASAQLSTTKIIKHIKKE